MKFEFLMQETPLGNLHGMEVGDNDDLAIHFHGTGGNFYENPFVSILSKVYNDAGWRYASVNLPSHDMGSITEQMADSITAIRTWLSKLVRPKSRVILQGHSLGALKLIRALKDDLLADLPGKITGCVLLAPFDAVAFNGGSNRAEIERHRQRAAALYADDPGALVPTDLFHHWPLSLSTYLDLTKTGGTWDVFPSRTGDHRRWLSGWSIPLLVAVGQNDFAAFPDSQTVVAGLEGLAGVIAFTVPGAPHNFAGHEGYLSDRLSEFLREMR